MPDLSIRPYYCYSCEGVDQYTAWELESSTGKCHYCLGRNLHPLIEHGEQIKEINLGEYKT